MNSKVNNMVQFRYCGIENNENMKQLFVPNRIRHYHVLMFIFLLCITRGTYAQSVDLDKKLGAENAALVEAQMGLYQDEKMTDYVRKIGNRLVSKLDKNPFEFHFAIADEGVPNAFALPGGYVYVTRGLLALVTTEDELACVMGHEIIHVMERHSIKQMRTSVLPRMLELPGNIVGTVVHEDLGNLVNLPISTSNTLLLSSYSRKHETESDTKGMTLASKAGYDPGALTPILERISKAVEVVMEEEEKKSYFSSHPYTPDRIKNIDKKKAKLNWEEEAKVSVNFPDPLDGLVFGVNPKKGIFKDQVFIHPDLNFTITFPEGWHTSNQSTAVAAIHEDHQAGVFVGLEDSGKSPEEYAKIFEEEIEKEHKQKPSISEPRKVNDHPGYLITMEDNSGSMPMYIHILWLKMDEKVFKLIGLAPRSQEPHLRATALSLRTLTAKERSSVNVNVLRVVHAKKNESIEALSLRSNNVLDSSLTSLINGIDNGAELKSKQSIKVIVKEKYENN